MGIITDEARQWAKSEFPRYVFDVGRRDIQKYAHAIGETNPIHFDPAAASEAGYADIVESIAWDCTPEVRAELMRQTGVDR